MRSTSISVFWTPKRGPQRKLIMDFIRELRDRPRTAGDYVDKDPSLRLRQIKIIGDYAITYWLDDPARSVMVVDVRPADQ
jgi:mRNA-degrading endonuclease RelE of RelBE toxin-antitoxin system